MDTPGSTLGFLSTPLATHRLQGKVAIITGGGGKIGIETAGRFLREAANVVLVDISPLALDAAVEILKGALVTGEVVTSRIHCIVADVATEAGVKHYVQSTVRIFNRLDVAFLNAGVGMPETSILETTEEDFDSVMRINVKSGLQGSPGLSVYSGSKFALRGLALSAAMELGEFGIRVNTIHPSGVDTALFRSARSEEKLEELKDEMPLGRFARVDDVASVVGFLASEDSKFMTGGFLKIDGGCVHF
ncbi:NAD(P)-binding protein [Byssothecium circinans]|uniref:NAD(P)-binding protein n=1 Tax=Byssothecium circinans TaxID=147558 RepID=A0A6A5TY76_9PLEO|nr:NAD(P)-binding protein [Byssothecium circinans]